MICPIYFKNQNTIEFIWMKVGEQDYGDILKYKII